MCVQNLKFVAVPVREIIGGTQKIWAVPVPNLKFVALSIPEIIGGFQKIWAEIIGCTLKLGSPALPTP